MEPFPLNPSSNASVRKEKDEDELDMAIVKTIVSEMQSFDDIDKRAHLADALADDRITEKEYYKILEMMSL